jgi:hypothetical protein
LREFDDNRRISVTEDTLHCEEPDEWIHHSRVSEPDNSAKEIVRTAFQRPRNIGVSRSSAGWPYRYGIVFDIGSAAPRPRAGEDRPGGTLAGMAAGTVLR